MNARKRRIGENEAIFRMFNEELGALSRTAAAAAEPLTIVCECGTSSCSDRFEIAPDAYARVREDPVLFVMKPGHDLPEAEKVIERNDTFWVVRKDPGLPAAIARATDPRSRRDDDGR